MLPLDYSGQIRYDDLRGLDAESFARSFLLEAVSELEKAKAKDIEVKGNRLTYKVALFRFVSNWNVLTLVDHGYFEVTAGNSGVVISYFINLRRFFFMTTAGLFVMSMLAFPIANLALGNSLFLSGVGLLWVLGGQLMIGLPRYSSFVNKIVREAAL